MTRGIPGSTPGHGTAARYSSTGCRCERCKAARMRLQKVYRLRQTPKQMPRHGTARRLKALAAIGWSYSALGARLGISGAAVGHLISYEGPVLVSTADRVRRLYDEVSMTPGASTITRQRAAARGWVSPLAWDDDTIDDPKAKPVTHLSRRERLAEAWVVDEIAIARVIAGDRVELTKYERVVVVERLAGEGLSDRQIAERVGVTPRTIERDRGDHGIESRWVA